jgi:hypothetical protein
LRKTGPIVAALTFAVKREADVVVEHATDQNGLSGDE